MSPADQSSTAPSHDTRTPGLPVAGAEPFVPLHFRTPFTYSENTLPIASSLNTSFADVTYEAVAMLVYVPPLYQTICSEFVPFCWAATQSEPFALTSNPLNLFVVPMLFIVTCENWSSVKVSALR